MDDPFAVEGGRLHRLAARLGCSEGQLWSLTIGLLLTVVILTSALPDVVWRLSPGDLAAAAPVAPPPAGDSAAAPSAGITPPIISTPRPATGATPPLPAPAPTPTDASGPSATSPTTPAAPAEPTPLRLADGGFATADAGTPLADAGIPAGALAIGQRAGRADKVAFIRLTGSASTLELQVDPSVGANVLDAAGGILVCPVATDGWTVGHGDVSLDDAPAYDCSSGRPGTRSADGRHWTFDLTGLDPTTPNGFALAPDPRAAPFFRIVLRGPEEEHP